MKKNTIKTKSQDVEMRAEYDFSNGVRGKHARAMQNGYTIRIRQADGTVLIKEMRPPKGAVILEPDVQAFFPDAESVNNTLRTLIQLIPEKRKAASRR
jgi:hypothetical protein